MKVKLEVINLSFGYRAIEKFADRKCFGSREVFAEDEETQPDGKIFKKVGTLQRKCYSSRFFFTSYDDFEGIYTIYKIFIFSHLRCHSDLN